MIKISFIVPQVENNNNNSNTNNSRNTNSSDSHELLLSSISHSSISENSGELHRKTEEFDFKPFEIELNFEKKKFYEININYDNVMKYNYFLNLFTFYKSSIYIYTNTKYSVHVIKILKFLETGSANYIRNAFKSVCGKIEKYIECNNTSDVCSELDNLQEFICLLIKYDIINDYSMLNYDLSHNKKLLNGIESMKILYNELNENTISSNNNNANNNESAGYSNSNNNCDVDYINNNNDFLDFEYLSLIHI